MLIFGDIDIIDPWHKLNKKKYVTNFYFHFLLKIQDGRQDDHKIYELLSIGQFLSYKVDLVVYKYIFWVKEFNFVH